MDAFSVEHTDFAHSARLALSGSARRASSASEWATSLWQLGVSAGWIELLTSPISPTDEGAHVGTALLFREFGWALAPARLRSTTHAAQVLHALQQRRLGRLADELAAGLRTATVAGPLSAVAGRTPASQVAARAGRGGWVLNGYAPQVLDARDADVLVVVAGLAEGPTQRLGVFAVPAASAGVSLRDHDSTCPWPEHAVTMAETDVPAGHLLATYSSRAELSAALEPAEQVMRALSSMEMAGGMEQVLSMTVTHAQNRRQFGRPIGEFQAVQHHVANLATDAQIAFGLALRAVESLGTSAAGAAGSTALAWILPAYRRSTAVAMQVHGAIGYTIEFPLHRWASHAVWSSSVHGGRGTHLDRIAEDFDRAQLPTEPAGLPRVRLTPDL